MSTGLRAATFLLILRRPSTGGAVTEEGIAVPYWASAALKFHSTYNPYIMTLEFSGTNVFF